MKNSSAFLHTSKIQIKTSLKFYLNSERLSSRKKITNAGRDAGEKNPHTQLIVLYISTATAKPAKMFLINRKQNDQTYSCPTPWVHQKESKSACNLNSRVSCNATHKSQVLEPV